mgnify:CR=1 FL=1
MKKQRHNTNPKAALCVICKEITCGAALVLSPLQIHAAESTALSVTKYCRAAERCNCFR